MALQHAVSKLTNSSSVRVFACASTCLPGRPFDRLCVSEPLTCIHTFCLPLLTRHQNEYYLEGKENTVNIECL